MLQPIPATDQVKLNGAAPDTVADRALPEVPQIGFVPGGIIVQFGPATTVTLKLHPALFPQWSVAAQLTVVVPTGNAVPDGGTQLTVGAPSQASPTVGAKFTTLLHSPRVTLPGQAIVGGVVSTTLMVWLQLAWLPQWSVAVQVRVTLKFCGHDPGVLTSLKVTVGFGSQASDTVGGEKLGVSGHSIVEFPAHVMVGAVVSTTLMV